MRNFTCTIIAAALAGATASSAAATPPVPTAEDNAAAASNADANLVAGDPSANLMAEMPPAVADPATAAPVAADDGYAPPPRRTQRFPWGLLGLLGLVGLLGRIRRTPA